MYRCDKCGCECGGNEQAEEEFKANFPEGGDHGVLCDDCYEKFWKWAETNAPELKRVHK